MRLLLPLCVTLLLSAFSASSQPTKPAQVCLPVAQAAKIADSLAVLPVVRREASTWQQAAGHFQQAADSLYAANRYHVLAYRAVGAALQNERLVSANETAIAARWRGKARHRGLVNYLLATLAGGSLYLLFTR